MLFFIPLLFFFANTESKVGCGGDERVISVTPTSFLWSTLPLRASTNRSGSPVLLNGRHLPLSSPRQGGKPGRGPRTVAGADMSIWVHVCMWVYDCELLCRVIHINEHLCFGGSAHIETLLVFFHTALTWGENTKKKKKKTPVSLCVRQHLQSSRKLGWVERDLWPSDVLHKHCFRTKLQHHVIRFDYLLFFSLTAT